MARHTKLTPELHQAIVRSVKTGLALPSAARLHNVDKATVTHWMALGEGPHRARPSHKPYAEFAEAVQQALAADEAARVLRIDKAGQGGQLLYERTTTAADGRVTTERRYAEAQWTADMTHLERRYGERWARKSQVELKIQREKVAEKIAQELGLTAAEVLAEAERLLKE